MNVRLLLETQKNSIVVPTAAMQSGPQGTFVYLVKPDKTVEVRPVTVSLTQGNNVRSPAECMPATYVVTDGQDKLQQGMTVVPQTRPANAAGVTDFEQRNAGS